LGAAVTGRHLDAHESVRAQEADVLERELGGLVVVRGAGRDLLPRDPPGHVLDHQLLFGEAEIHALLLVAAHCATACWQDRHSSLPAAAHRHTARACGTIGPWTATFPGLHAHPPASRDARSRSSGARGSPEPP